MKVVFMGAGQEVVFAAEALIDEGHDVVVLDPDRERIDELAERLDCGFLHGDGSRPALLREAGAEDTDVLFCLSDDDQANMLASLVGRHLGYRRIVVRVGDPELEAVCRELGLREVIVPSRTQARALVGMVKGMAAVELSTVLKNGASLFSFVAPAGLGKVVDLELPERAHVVWFYRGDGFEPARPDAELREGDEVVVLAHEDVVPKLAERWSGAQAGDDGERGAGDGRGADDRGAAGAGSGGDRDGERKSS
ncbi:MAG: TrkA family potassium uptake protein [Planctomycetota bacterium]